MKRHARSLGAKCLSCSWQHPDFDVAEGDHVPVVLQPDVALRVFPEARMRRELARRDLGIPVGTAEFILEELHAVEPVLDVVAVHDEARGVPLDRKSTRLNSSHEWV